MKIILSSLLFLVYFENFAQEFFISPTNPTEGDTIYIKYNPQNYFREEVELLCIAYFSGFDNNNGQDFPRVITVPLIKSGTNWLGRIDKIPDHSTSIVITFTDSLGNRDNNNGKGYWKLLYKDNIPVHGAWSGLGDLLYGDWITERCRFHLGQNLDSAKKYFLKEVNQQSETKYAYMRQYLASLKISSDADEQYLKKELEYFSKLPNLQEKDLDILKNNYQRLKDTATANYYNREILNNFPNGSLAVQTKSLSLLIAVGSSKDFVKQSQIYKQFKETYLKSYDNKFATHTMNGRAAQMLSYMAIYFVNQEMLTVWENELELLPNETKILTYKLTTRRLLDAKSKSLELGNTFSEHPFYQINFTEPERVFKAVENLSLNAIEVWNRSYLEPRRWNEPAFLTEDEVKIKRESELSELLTILGESQLKQNKLREAVQSLTSAVQKNNYSNATTNQLFIDALVKNGEYDIALSEATKVIKLGKSTSVIDAFYSNYKKEKDIIATLKANSLQRALGVMRNKRIYEKAPDFTFYNLKGEKITSQSLKNKIIVISFWASWCPPCVVELDLMNTAYDKYKQDDEVLFLMVNEDNTHERAMKQINQYENKSIFVFDLNREMVKRFGVKGLPTQVIINRRGDINFRTIGLTTPNSQEHLLALDAMIQLARH